jgi:hypothetical protein
MNAKALWFRSLRKNKTGNLEDEIKKGGRLTASFFYFIFLCAKILFGRNDFKFVKKHAELCRFKFD